MEDKRSAGAGLTALSLACVDDDAQGEVWSRSCGTPSLTVRFCKTRAGAASQSWERTTPAYFPPTFERFAGTPLLPPIAAYSRLHSAPASTKTHTRVNLLIADDVGAGKTVEAGLVLRELLLRRRIDLVLVAAPAGMVRQWQEDLEGKFGLSFTVIDRDYLAILRRDRGYSTNPWSSRLRFIISQSLMADETYMGGLRDLLGNFRPRALLILRRGASCGTGERLALCNRQPVHPRHPRACRAIRASSFSFGHAAQRPLQFFFHTARNP